MPSPKAPRDGGSLLFALWALFWPKSFFSRVICCVVVPIAVILTNVILHSYPWRWSFDTDPYIDKAGADSGISSHAAALPVQAVSCAPCPSCQSGADVVDLRASPSKAVQTTPTGAILRTPAHRAAPKVAAVVRKADSVWAIEQGPLAIQVELGSPENSMGSVDSIQQAGKDCWGPCTAAGLCSWCGAGNACCRKGFDGDPPICKSGKGFESKHHECVAVSMTVYKNSKVSLSYNGEVLLTSPLNGLWSVGRDLKNGWPSAWDYAGIDFIDVVGPWLVVEGVVRTPDGSWVVKDQWRIYDGVVEGFRGWTWSGLRTSKPSVMSVGWYVPGGKSSALLMPGVVYHGNPSGQKALKKGWALVPAWTGVEGDLLQVEEHRLAHTWASFEWGTPEKRMVAALDSKPSAPPFGQMKDQMWTLGAEALPDGTTLQLLSGPVALNGKTGTMKTGQNRKSPYMDVGLEVPSGRQVQKSYRLHLGGPVREGAGFRVPLDWTITRGDLSSDALPRFPDILQAKVRFTMSRWASKNKFPGFAMFPGNMEVVTMGWAGQGEAPGYALQVLADRLGQPELKGIAHQALDVLAKAKFNEAGFKLSINGHTGKWSGQDPVSQGQAMSAFARAIRYGRGTGAKTKTWEEFLSRACTIHAARILDVKWRPRSTAEAFIIQPLALGSKLFGNEEFLKAALRAGDHYYERHVGVKEPFWGGTLDASCEDKEGAWAGFEAFLALHEATGDVKWLDAANYAADMTLTYTYMWDVDMPPGRLRDHDLKTRGWTAVSVQNMHLDVYGVLYTPRLWRLGVLANRPELLRLAELMYRSCGQMLDAQGSQGEQLQQTRFAQAGDQSNPDNFRGGYVESWTVFWIAAHFLTAAAQFEEMGVLADLWERL